MPTRIMAVLIVLFATGLVGLAFNTTTLSEDEGAVVEGSGFSMFDTEAIVGYDEKKVENDPVCDRSKRPKILAVEPDIVKPGQSLVIKGENFGKKECFRGVSFSKVSKTKVAYKYVNSSTIEATVPAKIPAGMTFVITITGAGSAQSRGLLVTK